MIEDLMDPAILYSSGLNGSMYYLNTVNLQNKPYLKYNIRNERLEVGWFSSERLLVIKVYVDDILSETRTYTVWETRQMMYNPKMKDSNEFIYFDFSISEQESTLNTYKYVGVLDYYVGFAFQ